MVRHFKKISIRPAKGTMAIRITNNTNIEWNLLYAYAKRRVLNTYLIPPLSCNAPLSFVGTARAIPTKLFDAK